MRKCLGDNSHFPDRGSNCALARFPEFGRIVPELDESTGREILHGNYRI